MCRLSIPSKMLSDEEVRYAALAFGVTEEEAFSAFFVDSDYAHEAFQNHLKDDIDTFPELEPILRKQNTARWLEDKYGYAVAYHGGYLVLDVDLISEGM